MLLGNDFARFGFELTADLAAPGTGLEALVLPRCLLNRRDVVPGLIVTRTVAMMHRVKHTKPGLPRRIQDVQHVRNTVVRFGNALHAGPYLTPLGKEVVIRIDYQERRKVPLVRQPFHGLLSYD